MMTVVMNAARWLYPQTSAAKGVEADEARPDEARQDGSSAYPAGGAMILKPERGRRQGQVVPRLRPIGKAGLVTAKHS
jgi:hypothetical protein